MANVLLTPQLLTKLTLMNLGGYLNVCRNMSTEYSKEYGQKTRKIGDTFNVRKPQRFQTTDGITYQPQPLVNTQVPITVDQFTGVHFEFDSIERTLSLDYIQEKYAKPAAVAISHEINRRAAKYCALNTFNAVGTPGTTPTTIDTYLSAGDKIVQQGLPENERLACIINRKMSSQYVIGNKTVYNPAGQISSMIEKGKIVDSTLGYEFFTDQTIYTHTTGALGGTPLVSGSNQTADGGNNATMNLLTKGWTAAAAARLAAGDIFTIAGIYSVHPQTRQSTGDLQQFVVTAAFSSDGSGNGNVNISPALTASGQYQNVSALPADGAAITVLGAASTATPQGLLMHKDAFAFVSVPLENPEANGVEMVAQETDPLTGTNLSFIRDFDPVSRKHINRFDTMYGFGKLYPELACRIAA
jgi:hypothetical protein